MTDTKVAIVTGSTSGIGLEIAKRLARDGHNVVLNGLSTPEDMRPVIDALHHETGQEIVFNAANMSDSTEIATMIADVERQFGRIDVLVNNAGVQFVAPVEDFPIEKWNLILAINLTASFHTIRCAFPGMKQRRFGRIVQIASAHALVASPFKSAYVAAKHGIAGLTKTIALEGAEFGITCNAVCPGYVLTPLVEKQIPEQAKARGISEEDVVKNVLLAAQPTKAFITTAEVAGLVSHLCHGDTKSINGAIIPIDGGWTAH